MVPEPNLVPWQNLFGSFKIVFCVMHLGSEGSAPLHTIAVHLYSSVLSSEYQNYATFLVFQNVSQQ